VRRLALSFNEALPTLWFHPVEAIYKYKEEDITLLLDDGVHLEPTKAVIVRTIYSLRHNHI
jgi:hypothetical protein